MYLVMLSRSGPEWDGARPMEEQSDWPAHAAYMDGLADDGFLVLGGPLADEHRVAHVVESDSEDTVRARLAGDPWSGSHLRIDAVEPWTIRLSRENGGPRFVDEHRIRVAAPRERVWPALRRYAEALEAAERGLLARLLGLEPRSGFEISREAPYERIDLSGRHRFSLYRLEFALTETADGTTTLSARTFADFPGPHGRVYRALVIGTRGHVLAVRRMLRSIRRSSMD